MYRVVLLLLACLLLSAGCLTTSQPPAETEVVLITPANPTPIFGGQATLTNLIGEETPQILGNYSLAYVVIPPGNATLPHRLIKSTELIYMIDGVAEIRCDNETVTALGGETVLLPEGVLQSTASVGDGDLCYLSVVQPPYTAAIEMSGDELATVSMATDKKPIVVTDPKKGIEWNATSGTAIYTLVNPVLMSDLALPINYSLAYGEIQPGGYLDYDRINGSSDLLYVIEGELEVATPDGETVRVPAGSAAYLLPGQVKASRNSADSVTKILSFIDPAWTEEKTGLWE